MEKNRLKTKTPPLLQIHQAKTMKISSTSLAAGSNPLPRPHPPKNLKEGDEDYEVPLPMPRRVQVEADMASSVVSQTTQASRPTVAQKVPRKRPRYLLCDPEEEEEEEEQEKEEDMPPPSLK